MRSRVLPARAPAAGAQPPGNFAAQVPNGWARWLETNLGISARVPSSSLSHQFKSKPLFKTRTRVPLSGYESGKLLRRRDGCTQEHKTRAVTVPNAVLALKSAGSVKAEGTNTCHDSRSELRSWFRAGGGRTAPTPAAEARPRAARPPAEGEQKAHVSTQTRQK